MKVNKQTTIEVTAEEVKNMIYDYLTDRGHKVENIKFKLKEEVVKLHGINFMDCHRDYIHKFDGCEVECKEDN